MRVVFLILATFLVITMILLFLLKFKVLFLFTKENKSVFYTLNHRFFRLIEGKLLVLEDGSISIITKKNKILSKRVPKELSKNIMKEMLGVVKLSKVDIFIDVGKVGDAMQTALMFGGLDMFGGVLETILTNKRVSSHIHQNNDVSTREIAVAVNLNIKVSIINLIVAYIKAKKSFKQEEEKKYAQIQ